MSDVSERIASLSPAKRALLERMLRQRRGPGPGIRKVARTSGPQSFPLSFAQQRLWFLDQLDPGRCTYNITRAVRIGGVLSPPALQNALDAIVERHEALRTTFTSVDGRPVQVIGRARPVEVTTIDLSARADAEREAEAERLLNAGARRPFDLSRDLMLRATLVRLSEQDHALLLVMHHIASDGWSVGILFRELSVLYEAFVRGRPASLPELPIQYVDFAQWQRQWVQEDVLGEHLSYWKQQVGGALPVLELPADRPRPPVQSGLSGREHVALPKGLTESLKALGRQENATFFMTLLAAFQTLLHRYTGEDDIVVGSPIAGRDRVETEGLIGFFVNALVLRSDLSGDPAFREHLARAREVALGAYAHQALPLEKLVEELQPERHLSHSPLFQVALALQNAPRQPLELPGLSTKRIALDTGSAQFDVTLALTEQAEGLRGYVDYSSDLFDAGTMTRMVGHFRTLLEGIVADPDQRLSRLPLLTEPERRQLLVDWNDTATAYPHDRCVHELFQDQAERAPDATAVVFQDASLTYRELNRGANQLARCLRDAGVGPDTCVGVCMNRSAEMVVALLGVLKAGGAYVPLDPAYPTRRLAYMLKDAQVSVLVTRQDVAARFPEHEMKVIHLDSDRDVLARQHAEDLPGHATADNLAYVIYTSGSTGSPKGVAVPHRAVSRLVMNTDYARLETSDVVAQVSNVSFDAATFEIWGALLHGARLVGIPRDVLLSPRDFAGRIAEHGISVLFLTTGLFNMLARDVPHAFRTVRHLLTGGEAAAPRWFARVLEHGRPARLLHVYGPTEATTFTSWHEVKAVPKGAATIPIGRPVANTRVYLLDRHMQPVPVGVPGELHVGGPGLARGYLNRPELTARTFIPDPFSPDPHARLYRTGDRARYLPDGNLEFLGRTDDQVKVRGFRVELGEVEAALVRHPDIRGAVVTAREDESGAKRLVAYMVSGRQPPLAVQELRGFLLQELPYQEVPSAFVWLDALPLTPNGKVDRNALPAPDDTRDGLGAGFVEPRDTWEWQLATIWEDLLGVERVSVRDDFFDLGGHSLLAVRVFARIEKVFGRKLPLAAMFQGPTIERIAAVLREGSDTGPVRPLVPVHPAGSKRPFFCVHGAGGGVLLFAPLVHRMGPDQPFYGLRSVGYEGEATPLTTVEAMAARYLDEIRRVQPHGPYLLGGLCMGGFVAFEMAQRLHEQGEQVATLALIDTPWHPPRAVPGARRLGLAVQGRVQSAVHLAQRFAQHAALHLRRIRELPSRDRIRYLVSKLALLPGFFLGPTGYRPPLYMEAKQDVMRINTQAMGQYRPRPYPGRATLFLAGDTRAERAEDPRREWGRLARGGVDVHVLPGWHIGILQEPCVALLARQLTTCLDQAEETNPNEPARLSSA